MKNIFVLLTATCLLSISQVQATDPALAVDFDGANDFMQIPNSSAFNFGLTDNFTVSAWLKIPVTQTSTQNTDNDIIEKWSGGFSNGYPFVVRYINPIQSIQVARYNGAGTSAVITATGTYNDNQWHHVAFLKNGATLYLYIDGILNGTTPDVSSGTTSNSSPLYIACRGDFSGSVNFFTGTVEELQIWNVAQTQAQIQAGMSCPLSGPQAGLVAYYNFNNPSATAGGNNAGQTSVTDNSSNGNTGTLTNLALNGNISNWVSGQSNCTSSPIPTLSEWGLIIFALLLLCTGAVAVWNSRYGVARVKA